jgi:hypothetical protein
MSKSIPNFFWTALFLGSSCALLAGFASYFSFVKLPPIALFLPIAFFVALSVLLHIYLLKSTEGRPQRFVTAFMGVQAIKMFVHLMTMTIVGFLFQNIAVHFILVYAFYYLLFTLVETISLMRLFIK